MLREKALPAGHPDIAQSLNNIAEVYRGRGDHAKALEYHQRALALLEKALPPGHPYIAASLNNIALVYRERGDQAKALEYHQRALALREKALPPGHPHIARSLNGIANVYSDRGDYPKALDYYQRALALREKALPQGHPDIGGSLANIATVYGERGDHAKALEYHQRALTLLEKALPAGHPHIAGSLHNIAVVYDDRGDHAKALEYLQRALDSLRLPGTRPPLPVQPLRADQFLPSPIALDIARYRASLLQASLPAREKDDALRACLHAYDLAADLHDRCRGELLEREDSRLQATAEGTFLLPGHLAVRQTLFNRQGKVADLHGTVSAIERSRARVFADTLARSHATLLAGAPADLHERELDLAARLRALDRQTQRLLDRPGPEFARDLARLDAERRQVEEDQRRLVAKIEAKASRYAALKYPRPCTVDEARACLAPNEVALLFAPGRSFSVVVLLEGKPDPADKAQGVAVFRFPGTAAFRDQIAALTDPENLAQVDEARALGAELYDLLLAPLAGRIQGKDLVVVADGALCLLPFELLVEKGQFLIESHRIRYAPSLSALHAVAQWHQKRQRPDRPLFALGDPVFGPDDDRLAGKPTVVALRRGSGLEDLGWREGRMRGEEAFRRLVHSGREVEAIAERLGATKEDLLLGFDATLARLRQASQQGRLARARFVHFATHGILGVADKQQPALVLGRGKAPATKEAGEEDQLLRLSEVAGLRLNADLVVLSACRTGQGQMHDGEGVTCLARAFLAAGSRGVVCSLWSVDDRETATLMKQLYGELLRNEPAADALRTAKREMIRRGKAPFYWAPFILLGE